MLIDPEDWVRVLGYRWRKHKGYYITSLYMDFQNRPVFLHHFLIGMPINRNLEVDHINRNPEDNRKRNLHFVTHKENMQNLSLDKRNKAGITGVGPVVAKTTRRGKTYIYYYWRAQVYEDGKQKTLGYFKTKLEAIFARRTYETKV